MEQHVIIERERILTPTLILRPWSREDAEDAFEIYGDRAAAEAIGRREPVGDVSEMRDLVETWNLQSSSSPVPQGLWAVEDVNDGRLLGGATLLPFSVGDPELVMGWHLRPAARGHGLAGAIGHALAHQAFAADDVTEVYVAAAPDNTASVAVARRLGMKEVDTHDWRHHGARLAVFRMDRADLHNIRPGVSLDSSYNPEGLDDW
jgi:RimJ/RimL family protein N-acetyltransferase